MLRAFFDANPEYFLTVQGEPAAPTEAHEEIHGELPSGWSFTKRRWAMANGAKWLRLGVVRGNSRGERFWESAGYIQTRLRHGVAFGAQTNTLRVMFKPLARGTLEEYLSLVPRDRPEVPNAL